jgi:predicted nucleic acid-binding protein
MIQKIFFDTNIILDVILDRLPFSNDASEMLSVIDEYDLEIYASSLSIANTAYILDKLKQKPHAIISKLLYWVKVIDLNKEIIDQTAISKFEDFEDGLQYFSALSTKGIEAIITRDKKGFTLSKIPVFTPAELVTHFKS